MTVKKLFDRILCDRYQNDREIFPAISCFDILKIYLNHSNIDYIFHYLSVKACVLKFA